MFEIGGLAARVEPNLEQGILGIRFFDFPWSLAECVWSDLGCHLLSRSSLCFLEFEREDEVAPCHRGDCSRRLIRGRARSTVD